MYPISLLFPCAHARVAVNGWGLLQVVYLKSRPQAKDLEPSTTGDNAIYGFESGDYKYLSPLHKAPTQLPFDATRTYPTLEHALAASKVPPVSSGWSAAARAEALDAIRACDDALGAKRLGSKHLGKSDSAAAVAWRAKSLEVRPTAQGKPRRNPTAGLE